MGLVSVSHATAGFEFVCLVSFFRNWVCYYLTSTLIPFVFFFCYQRDCAYDWVHAHRMSSPVWILSLIKKMDFQFTNSEFLYFAQCWLVFVCVCVGFSRDYWDEVMSGRNGFDCYGSAGGETAWMSGYVSVRVSEELLLTLNEYWVVVDVCFGVSSKKLETYLFHCDDNSTGEIELSQPMEMWMRVDNG